MNYTNVLKGFFTEWEALRKLAEEDAPEVPTLSTNAMKECCEYLRGLTKV